MKLLFHLKEQAQIKLSLCNPIIQTAILSSEVSPHYPHILHIRRLIFSFVYVEHFHRRFRFHWLWVFCSRTAPFRGKSAKKSPQNTREILLLRQRIWQQHLEFESVSKSLQIAKSICNIDFQTLRNHLHRCSRLILYVGKHCLHWRRNVAQGLFDLLG